MKTLSVLCGLLAAVATFAGESTKYIDYQGQSQADVELSSSKYHTEYRYERIWTTCSRQVPDGYETICNKSLEKRRICERINDRTVCHDDGGGNSGGDHHGGGGGYDHGSDHSVSCYSRQTYRTEYYSCEEVVAHPYSVFDYSTRALAAAYFGPWPLTDVTPAARFAVSLSDDGQLSASAAASGAKPAVLIYGQWSDEQRGGNNSERTVAANLSIGFRAAGNLLHALEKPLTQLSLNNDKITFVMNKGESLADYEFAVTLTRVRWFILKDVVVVKQTLTSKDVDLQEKDGQWIVSIDIARWHKLQQNKKYKLDVAVTLASPLYERLLNRADLPKSKARGQLKQKL